MFFASVRALEADELVSVKGPNLSRSHKNNLKGSAEHFKDLILIILN